MRPIGGTGTGRWARSARALSVRLGIAVSAVLLGGAANPAVAAVEAPGFFEGPRIVEGGLLWAGTERISLTTARGTRLILRNLSLPQVLVEGSWTVVVDSNAALKAGRTGGPVAPIRTLESCFPRRASSEAEWLVALVGGNLYTVVPAGCVGRSPEEQLVVIRVRLSTGALRVIATAPDEVAGLAAAGGRLALTYLPRRTHPRAHGRVRVEVLDRSSGRLLYTVVSPALAPLSVQVVQRAALPLRRRLLRPVYRTQLDSAGDVLVMVSFGGFGGSDWWGNAKMHLARRLDRPAGGILSDGRIAYTTGQESEEGQEGDEHIDVLNLKTGRTRTEVAFRGAARVEGLGFQGARLAWAQASYGYSLRKFGRNSCVEFGKLDTTELVEATRFTAGPPLVVERAAPPKPAGVPCPRLAY